jgi:L,D-transpeptidase YcbB
MKQLILLACLVGMMPSVSAQSGRQPATPPSAPAAPVQAAPFGTMFVWPREEVRALVAMARTLPAHGMSVDPAAEPLEAFLDREAAARAAPAVIESLDFQINMGATDLFRRLAEDFGSGRAIPRFADPDWKIAPPVIDTEALLRRALGGEGVEAVLNSLSPTNREYQNLQLALLRETAARPADAAATRAQAQRITAIRADLERWRWLPRKLPDQRIEVRIPFYTMRLVRPGASDERFNVIVGAPSTRTLSMISQMNAVVLNPTWTPPRGIAMREILPGMRANPASYAARGFELVSADGTAVSPTAVDLSTATADTFDWTIRQRSGSNNALGEVKFPLNNRWAIYLHDTASRDLFSRQMRALSHGCIRVQNPLLLAEKLLGPSGTWSMERLRQTTANDTETPVRLAAPLDVMLVYLTTEEALDGSLTFAPDVYRRNPAMVRALDAQRRADTVRGISFDGRISSPL